MFIMGEEKESQNPVEQKLSNFGYNEFKACLIHANEHPIRIERLPDRIETGPIGDELNKYNVETQNDPELKERGELIFINKEGELTIPEKPVIGAEDHVDLSEIYNNRPPNNRFAVLLHTHPWDGLASAEDISCIVTSARSPNSANALMTATPEVNVLFLRTAETKTLPASIRDGWVAAATKHLFEMYDDINPGFTIWNRHKKITALSSVKNSEWVGKICKKHGIATYTCKAGATEYIKAALV